MSLLFRPWTNTAFRIALGVLAGGAALSIGGLMVWARSPLRQVQHEPIEQPVEFDHRHHVADEGIDCRFCHSTVESSPRAGIPSTQLCMGCHGQIWNKSPLLKPVREAYYTDRPIPWRRVNRLPDFVYFNHSVHVNKGVGCVECHGRVDQQAAIERVAPLTMSWCLDCHRNPQNFIRPVDKVTDMAWERPKDPGYGEKMVQQNGVHTRVSCTTCHR